MDKKIIRIVQSALIASIYAGATYLSSLFGVAYGPIQFRLSEILTVLAALTPSAIPGLTIGCVLGNITSPMGFWDVIFGSFATLISCLCARKLRHLTVKEIPVLSILMPVIFNAIIVGIETAFLLGSKDSLLSVFALNVGQIAIGELVVCVVGGIPFYLGLKKTGIFKKDD